MEVFQDKTRQVCVAGAGIAGMSAAIALANKGIKVTLLEKEPYPHEAGAGIQLAPNATSLLHAWGVLDSLYEDAVEPDKISLKDGRTSHTLMQMAICSLSRQRWKAPYITIHRADLQTALKKVVDRIPLITFKAGHEIVSYAGSALSGFRIKILHGHTTSEISTPCLINCDGIRSKMRKKLSEQAIFSGYTAWRTTLMIRQGLPVFLDIDDSNIVCVWMGANGHFITYPLKNGQYYNFVAITMREHDPHSMKHSGKVGGDMLVSFFKGWHPTVVDMIQHVQKWTCCPIFHMPFPRFFGPAGEIFLGDASHALTPFTAQGAAMAIEDAAALAHALAVNA